jgi:hypothetical protein
MANIDSILDRMTERGAQALSLRVGQIPVVRVGADSVPVQRVALSAEQVLGITRPMAQGEDAARLDRGEPCSFRYRDFEVRVTFSSTGPAVEIVPLPPPVAAAVPLEIELAELAAARQLPRPAGTPAPVSAAPPAPVPAAAAADLGPPPPVWADPERRGTLVKVAALVLLVVSVLFWYLRPVDLPNVPFEDASGGTVTLDDMRQDKPQMLVVFFMTDPVSKYALDAAVAAYPEKSHETAFVGLFFGSAAEAEAKRKEMAIPFPVYGARSSKDPFALETFFKKAGTSHLGGAAMYGGTTLLLDRKNRIVFKLEQEDVKTLPAKLSKLKD